jgi:Mrp family chromosome partitioning ATPase
MLLYEVFFKLSFAAEGKIRAVWEVTDVVVLAKMLVELIVVAVVRPAVLARTAADRAAQVLTLHVVERLGLVEEASVAELAKRMAGEATAAELGVGINDAAALLMVFELGF